MTSPPPPLSADLSGPTKILAERLEPRLAAGVETFGMLHGIAADNAKTFAQMKRIFLLLSPLIVAGFLVGAWQAVFARKSDVSQSDAITTAWHADLDKRTAALELQRSSDAAAIAKTFADVSMQLREQANVLLDIRIRLGPPSTVAVPSLRPIAPPRAATPKAAAPAAPADNRKVKPW